jgi:hypothetical protein
LCASYWEHEFFLECALEYAPFDVMVIVVVVANRPFGGVP